MKSDDELLERSKWGTVTEEEMAGVAQRLDSALEGEQYTLLHILGRGGEQIMQRGGRLPSGYTRLVERFLPGPDETLARLALWILCRWWGLAEHYPSTLLQFIRGVAWDLSRECRWTAIALSGEYLTLHTHAELLQELLRTYRDTTTPPDVRQYAYFALAEAVGRERRTFPPLHEDIEVDPPPDPTILTEALARLATRGG
jgi:hypothetical protein